MATGFALLSISPLHEKEVFEALNQMPEISEVHPLFGEYDILVKIECEDIDTIGEVVIKKIRSLSGIVDSKTVDSKTMIGTKSLSGEL
jgi:DNA-binding Lrp family transcriptional regulator